MITKEELELMCASEGIPSTPEIVTSMMDKITESRRLVDDFCRKYHTHLRSIGITSENTTSRRTVIEPIYFFSDNLGGYTFDALRASL